MGRHKYNVAPAHEREYNGRTYASKAERLYAEHIDNMVANGIVREFVTQPLFHLGRDTTYRADFLLIYADGRVEAIDVKGVETQQFKRTKKLWSEYAGIPLRIVKRKGKAFHTSEVVAEERGK